MSNFIPNPVKPSKTRIEQALLADFHSQSKKRKDGSVIGLYYNTWGFYVTVHPDEYHINFAAGRYASPRKVADGMQFRLESYWETMSNAGWQACIENSANEQYVAVFKKQEIN